MKRLFEETTCISETGETIVDLGLRGLSDWLEKSRRAAFPTNAESLELRNALNASRGMLEKWHVEELQFCLKSLK